VKFSCLFLGCGLHRLLERPATPPAFSAVDCTIDIVCKTALEHGVEYVLEGIVSSVFGYANI